MDIPPEVSTSSTPMPKSLPQVPPGSYAVPRVILHVRDTMRTVPNRFGILHEYPHRPSYDPDTFVPHEDLSNYQGPASVEQPPGVEGDAHAPPWPFTNMSIYLLMQWMITGGNQKSVGEVDRLAAEVLTAKEFKPEELTGFSAWKENRRLDKSDAADPDGPYSKDGWVETDISISIPTGVKDAQGRGQLFSVPGLHYRSLLGVMKSAITDITAHRFHFSPFKRLWQKPSGAEERCFDEAYTSDAWIETHDKLQKQPNEPGCTLEKVVLGLMFWSDSTHLASFGTAKVWPLYLYFANLSKYFRGKPTSGASHHVAYIPSVCHFLLCS
jgi:hypothetical protein